MDNYDKWKTQTPEQEDCCEICDEWVKCDNVVVYYGVESYVCDQCNDKYNQ